MCHGNKRCTIVCGGASMKSGSCIVDWSNRMVSCTVHSAFMVCRRLGCFNFSSLLWLRCFRMGHRDNHWFVCSGMGCRLGCWLCCRLCRLGCFKSSSFVRLRCFRMLRHVLWRLHGDMCYVDRLLGDRLVRMMLLMSCKNNLVFRKN